MSESLKISMRPRTFDDMVGAEKIVKRIRKRFKEGRIPKAWMFIGPAGSGKTTIARILATSMQCRHQKVFGNPCRHCWKHWKEFEITVTNASKETGKEKIEDVIDGCNYAPRPGSKCRTYIFDECHRLSQGSQNLLLIPTEQCPRTTNWIFNTTRVDNILDTLQGRCAIYKLPGLELEGIKTLIKKALRKLHSDRSISELAERLMEKNITSPRLVVEAAEKYSDPDTSADEATEVTLVSDVDTYALCRAVIKGEWEAVAKLLSKAEDCITIRKGVAGYLNSILLGDTGFSHRTRVVAHAIKELSSIRDNDMPATSAALWQLCKEFSKEKR